MCNCFFYGQGFANLVEIDIYDPNSSTRLKNIKRHEFELKWIICLQSSLPLGFNDDIYHEGNVSKMPVFGFFSFGQLLT